jgi:hypothetical protein
MGLSVTGIHRAIDIRENLRRRLNVSDNTPVTKISGAEREHLQHCIWSSSIDQIFRRTREEDGTVYYESIYGGYQRQIAKGSVVVNAPFVVGRPINIGNYDSDTGKQEMDYLLSMVSLVPRKWLKDGHANLPGRHEVRDALANTPDALPPRRRKPQRDKQFFRPDGHQGRRGSGRF